VVVGNNHNPTLLNPDFLIRTGIIDKNWPVDTQRPVITTPVHSEVTFRTGIKFVLEPDKLIVSDSEPGGDFFPVPSIVTTFLTNVPHVNYTSIGINFEKVVYFPTLEDANYFQKNKYLKKGPWDRDGSLIGFTTKFVYKIPDGQCNIQFTKGIKIPKRESSDEDQYGIIIRANFHRDFSNDDSSLTLEEMKSTIDKWDKDRDDFNDIVTALL
jgi:hypothetical protein